MFRRFEVSRFRGELKEKPVLEHLLAVGGEDALGVELDAADVQLLVLEGHDLAFVAEGGDFEAVGETVAADHPGVVASHGDAAGQTGEDGVVAQLGALGGYAVEDVGEVLELGAEDLADGLMAEADTQNGLAVGIGAYDVEQKSCLRGYARTGREDDFAVLLQVGQLELVVAQDGHLSAQGFDQVGQIVGEGVVVVDDDYFHCWWVLVGVVGVSGCCGWGGVVGL